MKAKIPRLPAGYELMTQDELRRWMDMRDLQGLVRAKLWAKWTNRRVQR